MSKLFALYELDSFGVLYSDAALVVVLFGSVLYSSCLYETIDAPFNDPEIITWLLF